MAFGAMAFGIPAKGVANCASSLDRERVSHGTLPEHVVSRWYTASPPEVIIFASRLFYLQHSVLPALRCSLTGSIIWWSTSNNSVPKKHFWKRLLGYNVLCSGLCYSLKIKRWAAGGHFFPRNMSFNCP